MSATTGPGTFPELRKVLHEHASAGHDYVSSLRETAGDLQAPAMKTATARLAASVSAFRVAHRDSVGADIPSGPFVESAAADRAGERDIPDEDDPIWALQEQVEPALGDRPVYVALQAVVASGDWGVVRVRQALVYSTGVRLEIESFRLRMPGEDDEAWGRQFQDDGAELTFDDDRFDAELVGEEEHGDSRFHRSVSSHWLAAPFADGQVQCVLAFPDVQIGEVRFELDLAALLQARKSVTE